MKKLLAAMTVLAVSTAHAATIHVDIANCPGPGDGSVGDPYCSIQTAIDNAVDTDEVVVAEGTYLELIDFLGKAISLRSTVPEDPAVVANTVIDGVGFAHVIQCVSGEGPDTLLSGFTITGGNAAGGGDVLDERGGGMLNNASDPTVTNCTFSGNMAGTGGGMYSLNSSPTVMGCTFSGNSGGGMTVQLGSLTLIDCTFSGNTGSSGGGVAVLNGSLAMIDCTFIGNSAESTPFSSGGAVYFDGSDATATGCTFLFNTASSAGGGFQIVNSDTATFTDCTFVGNSGDTGAGARIQNVDDITVSGCIFANNSSFVGSGLNCQDFSTLNVTDSVFAGNGNGAAGASAIFAVDGALTVDRCVFSGQNAGAAIESGFGTILLTNSIFTGNVGMGTFGGGIGTTSSGLVANCLFAANTATRGGGIYCGADDDDLAIVNCTFVDNTPAGITADSGCTPLVFNCLFWGNSPHQLTGDPIGTPSGASVFYSNVQDGFPGAGNIDADPMLVSAQSGTWSDQAVFDPVTGLSTFVDDSAAFVPGELVDRFLAPFVVVPNLYAIADNSATTIMVYGDFALFGFPGAEYRIEDFRLTVDSPCIDAADNSAVPEDVTADLDGNPRFLDVPETPDSGNGTLPIVDMGAYESLGGGCLAVMSQEILCHADGTTFTVNIDGLNACTGGTTQVTFTGSGGAVGEQLCFTALVNDGGFCCSTEICITIPDCTPAALPSDLDGDGIVGMVDLLALLGAWGSCSDCGTCPADFDGDCSVGILDLLSLLGNWG